MPDETSAAPKIERWDCFCPLDSRYAKYLKPLEDYFSENAFTRAKLEVEAAIAFAWRENRWISDETLDEISKAVSCTTTDEVYMWEAELRHDIRALVRALQSHVSAPAKPWVHFGPTSYDIIDTARAYLCRNAMVKVVHPALRGLIYTLCEMAEQEAVTPQIGRTHGQHGLPITFGFELAQFVSRLGGCAGALWDATHALVGKCSGAMGAYNSFALFVDDPEGFEWTVVEAMGLQPAEISTQITPPEPMTRLLMELGMTAGVMANLARNLRNLQRTEIAEVRQTVTAQAVGSSTMPHKLNPDVLEFVESVWKIVIPRLTTILWDQVSEHQRDLTGSASARTYQEIICWVYLMAVRLNGELTKLFVDRDRMYSNLQLEGDLVVSEAVQLVLAAGGHEESHKIIQQLSREARDAECSLQEQFDKYPELLQYLNAVPPQQRERLQEILANPAEYNGIAAEKAREVARYWRQTLKEKYEVGPARA